MTTTTSTDDVLSYLPDEILVKILLLLPVKTSASLSVVSRRFRHLLSLLPHLPLLDSADPPIPLPNAFLHRLELPLIHLLSFEQIRAILLSAADRGLLELTLANAFCILPIPNNIFQIKSLQMLSATKCGFRWPSRIQCANLRTLRLHCCCIDDSTLNLLVSSCPRLDTLHLVHFVGASQVSLKSMSLKHLRLEPDEDVESIYVRAPRLLSLTVCTLVELKRFMIEAPWVQKCCMNLKLGMPSIETMFCGFLLQVKNLVSLELQGSSFQLFLTECGNLERLNISFDKLKALTVGLDFTCEHQVSCLVKLLQFCPCLAQLSLYFVQCIYRIDHGHVKRPRAIFEGLGYGLKLLQCLAHHLVEVEMHGFKDELNYQEFVRVLLSEAKSMKKMLLQFPFGRGHVVENMLLSMNQAMEISSTPSEGPSILLKF